MTHEYSREEGLLLRQTLFDRAKRIVVKVGSAVLTDDLGIAVDVIENIAREIAFLHDSGREVILVSSGAVAAGRARINFKRSGSELGIKEKQALAAIGQSSLMQIYDHVFENLGQTTAQVLLTHNDLAVRKRYLNARNTLFALFGFDVIPIINENDTVSVAELRFGDNDMLGAYICNLIEADMFICLTDVVGLYTGNPATDPEARPIYTVDEITAAIEAMASHSKSKLGTGGMQSKLRAAKLVSSGGGSSFIGPGHEPEILKKLFSGEMVGTFFLPHKEHISGRKRWIASVLKPQGSLILDDGACTALVKRNRSLLPSGIVEVEGSFGVGDAVHCKSRAGEKIAVGLINYSSADTNKIRGYHSREIERILGYRDSDDVIHRDNMVII